MTRWVEHARTFLGTKEFPGKPSNPVILKFWVLAKLSGIKDDAIPWCSGFACAMFEAVGIRSPRSDGAKNWLNWGVVLQKPVYGCVVVFKRPGGYHVGIVVGQDKAGNLQVLGGNQGDKVSIATYPRASAEGYRFPIGEPIPQAGLPVLVAAAKSTSEA